MSVDYAIWRHNARKFALPRIQDGLGKRKAIASMRHAGIDGLIVIRGNGSQIGSYALSQLGFPVVGIASTIDNDLFGSDITIGVDTALNVAIESIDRLRNTAQSHHRAFLVEVMGAYDRGKSQAIRACLTAFWQQNLGSSLPKTLQ